MPSKKYDILIYHTKHFFYLFFNTLANTLAPSNKKRLDIDEITYHNVYVKMLNLPKFRGFTLVELLVVMSIIGILATVILGGFRASQKRARDTKRKSDLQQVAKALEMFYSDHERYPNANLGKLVACEYVEGGVSVDCDWGQGQFSDGNTTYFRQIPDDLSGNNYYYRTLESNRAFQLYAHLENPEDRGCIVYGTGVSNCTNPVLPPSLPLNSCGGACNFAVTSTNVTPAQD